MESATGRGEPLFVLPDGRAAPWPQAVRPGENNKPARDLASTGRVGLMETSLGQNTTAETTQVAPLIGGNASPSGADLGEGERGEWSSIRRLGGQARSARPALGECQRFDCGRPATQIKTLYCRYQGEYCDEHVGPAW